MTGETLSADVELETANPSDDMPDTELEAAIGEGDDEVEDLGDPDDDLEEVDWSGKKFRAPKGLKDGLMMHADYTRKTQEVSESRKALDQRASQLDQQARATEEELDLRSTVRHFDSEIKRLEGFGWAEYQTLRATDPMQADEIWAYKTHVEKEKSKAEQVLGEKQQARTREAQQGIAKRIEDTKAHARKIPGMTEQIYGEVMSLAQSKGISRERLAEVIDPTVFDIMYHARLGYNLVAKRNAPKPAAPPPAPVEAIRPRRNPPPAGLSDRLSTDEWIKRRNAELEKR